MNTIILNRKKPDDQQIRLVPAIVSL